MESSELTGKIMGSIVRFEAVRTRREKAVLYGTIAFLVSVLAITVTSVIYRVRTMGSLAILEVFREDREIIRQYWTDAVGVFWDELPQKSVIMIGLGLVALSCVIVCSAKRRKIFGKRTASMRRYLSGKERK